MGSSVKVRWRSLNCCLQTPGYNLIVHLDVDVVGQSRETVCEEQRARTNVVGQRTTSWRQQKTEPTQNNAVPTVVADTCGFSEVWKVVFLEESFRCCRMRRCLPPSGPSRARKVGALLEVASAQTRAT